MLDGNYAALMQRMSGDELRRSFWCGYRQAGDEVGASFFSGIPQQRVDQGDRWKENRRSSEDSEPATLDKRLQKNHIADGTNGAESMLRVSFPKNPLRNLTMSDGRSDLTREPHPDHNFSISGR